MRRVLAALAVALCVVVAAAKAGPLAAAASSTSASSTSAAADGMNHAAVVIDTGDGNVRKLCLAFPEAEISGIEALQRVDTRPHRFETFNGKGSGVCMLCGVGCASGDCFCDKSNYWAYHRAGPGEPQYRTSSIGASNTVVRNGDVEAWKWGPGTPPAKTSVSDVCAVPEPPARATGTNQTTTTTAATATEPTPTTASQSPAPPTPAPAPATAPTSTPAAKSPAASPTPTPPPPTPGADAANPGEVAEATSPEGPEEETAAPSAAEVKRSLGAEEGAAVEAQPTSQGTSRGQQATLAAFAALLGGLLVWRSRIRRANMRRVRPVR